MNYQWVDEALKQLGLELDLKLSEIPSCCKVDDVSVNSLMGAMTPLFTEQLQNELHKSTENWSVDVGRYEGALVVSNKAIFPNVENLEKKDFVKFVVDDAMTDVAHVWDDTFVEGKFVYYITKDSITQDGSNIRSLPCDQVAKIMRWIFKVPSLAPRELVSVYVTYLSENEMFTSYFPVKAEKLFRKKICSTSLVRARLLVPCLDRMIKINDKIQVEHYTTAETAGWLPNFILNSYFGKKAYFDACVEEAEHLFDLLSKGKEFKEITLKDGTTT